MSPLSLRNRTSSIRRKITSNMCHTNRRLLSRLSRVSRECESGNSVGSRPWLSRGRRVTGSSRSSRIAMNEIRSTTAWSWVRPPRWINPLPSCRVDAPCLPLPLFRLLATSTPHDRFADLYSAPSPSRFFHRLSKRTNVAVASRRQASDQPTQPCSKNHENINISRIPLIYF